MTEKHAPPQPSGEPRRTYRWLLTGAGIALAAGVLALLIQNTSLTDAKVWKALSAFPLTIGAVGIAAAIAQSLLSTVKWHKLLNRAAPELTAKVGFKKLFAYTALGNLLAQFLPAYVAGPLVRGAAMKSQHETSFAQTALVSAYEQLFDLLIVVIGGGIALTLLFVGWGEDTNAIVLFALALLILPMLLAVLPESFLLGRLARLLPRRWRFTSRMRDLLELGSSAGFNAPRFTSLLCGLSALRYAIVGVRTVILGALLLPLVPFQTVGLGFGAVQLSGLATITPGNLGITELGWGAMANFSGQAVLGEFVAFALALRIISFLSSAIVGIASLISFKDG